jgi:predicted transcriptional regulator
MPAEKTVPVSFRVSPHFKHLLEAAAASQRRSQTNMLETLLFDFCERNGIQSSEGAGEKVGAIEGGAKK